MTHDKAGYESWRGAPGDADAQMSRNLPAENHHEPWCTAENRCCTDIGPATTAKAGSGANLPVPMSYEALAVVLRGMADLVEHGDSLEGSIEYTIPTGYAAPEEVAGDVMVRASFRIGNRDGQGGVRIIGTLGR